VGSFYYGNNGYAVEVDDRPLAHLKIAVLSLLRAGTCLAYSFERSMANGGGRETLWISPSTEIRFRFNGSRVPKINMPWVQAIIASASTPTGMRMVGEPAEADASVMT
jgi:hypothetical protein